MGPQGVVPTRERRAKPLCGRPKKERRKGIVMNEEREIAALRESMEKLAKVSDERNELLEAYKELLTVLVHSVETGDVLPDELVQSVMRIDQVSLFVPVLRCTEFMSLRSCIVD